MQVLRAEAPPVAEVAVNLLTWHQTGEVGRWRKAHHLSSSRASTYAQSHLRRWGELASARGAETLIATTEVIAAPSVTASQGGPCVSDAVEACYRVLLLRAPYDTPALSHSRFS